MNQMKRGVKAAKVLKDDKTIRREDDKSVSEEVTKLLGHYGTKVVSGIKDDKALKHKDDKFETEIVAISRHSERQRKNPADKAAKQLGSEAAKRNCHSEGNNNFLPKNLATSNQLDLVGWDCEIADEWLTRGARNEIHICDSNMNGSYEREAISRRYPNSEKSTQSYPSPEFLNSLSFIKKFYPTPRWGEGKLLEL